jgi:hypothetical protein
MNYLKASTAIDRNSQVGGHKGWYCERLSRYNQSTT